jgi:hypothetical protein
MYLVLAGVLFSGVAAQDGPVNVKIGNSTIERVREDSQPVVE